MMQAWKKGLRKAAAGPFWVWCDGGGVVGWLIGWVGRQVNRLRECRVSLFVPPAPFPVPPTTIHRPSTRLLRNRLTGHGRDGGALGVVAQEEGDEDAGDL